MEQIQAGTSEAYSDVFLLGPMGEPLIISFFERSAQMARAVGASLVLDGNLSYRRIRYHNENRFLVNYTTITRGKEKFTHGLAVAENLDRDYLVTTETGRYQDLYHLLMNQYSLPLMEWWMPEIMEAMIKAGCLGRGTGSKVYGNPDRMIQKGGEKVPVRELCIHTLQMTEEQLKGIVSRLLRNKCIWITKNPQQRLSFKNLDEYFQMYGKSVVDNLDRLLKPVSELNGEVTRITLKTMRLYPQQAAMVNGIYEYLRTKKSGAVFFCMGTGSGKTIQAAAAAEMLYVGKWLREHPDKTLADAYAAEGIINYRHIIMAPGHLVEKWKKELLREIPYARPVIVDSFHQLTELRKGGKERKFGKEFYILSKDFLKLSYQRIPTPRKEGIRCVDFFKCVDCGAIQTGRAEKCSICDSENIAIIHSRYKRRGLICPGCNRLLFKNSQLRIENFDDSENPLTWPFKWFDMESERQENRYCVYCGEALWMPFVKNINMKFGYNREPAWIRQTFWANKSKRGKVTNWVLKGREAQAEKLWGKCLNSLENSGGCRKYSPALYIKKYLKDFFDVFIMDEAHKAKGGATAQGNAFHCLNKSSRYTFNLTGTIAGGVASDLFYLLFRVCPQRMIAHGYRWESVMQFAKDYGCVETEYSVGEDVRRNVLSRGRQICAPRMLPGISPMVFSEFLLDQAVFLDISDMSANMPPLYERVILCAPDEEDDLEKEAQRQYRQDIRQLKEYERTNKVSLMSIRNQFAMSYLDKPYGAEPILDPRNGSVIVRPGDYKQLVLDGNMLSKERRLIEIVKKELLEGRNCVIYVEYSQSEATNVLPRLKELIQEHCHLLQDEVVILRSQYPQASLREAWMHRRAEEGMKVMLCNPRLCETGLDFCWKEKGVVYNFPTLVFYQCGYSLFVTWQAAGRSWRLNQREECRTYYIAYENTVQQAILQVLGEKKAATAAIQGRFSAEGLAAMAQGVNTQVRIAQIMSEMDETSGNRLQEMFDVIVDSMEDTYGECRKMQLFGELVDTIRKAQKTGETESGTGTIFDLFGQLFAEITENAGEALEPAQVQRFFTLPGQYEEMISGLGVVASYDAEPIHKRRKKKCRKPDVYENYFSFTE